MPLKPAPYDLEKLRTMEPRDFCAWLRGFIEIGRKDYIDTLELNMIKTHLDLVFIPVQVVPMEDRPKTNSGFVFLPQTTISC